MPEIQADADGSFTQAALGAVPDAFGPGAAAPDAAAGLAVKFFTHPVLNQQKSDAEGRPIYDEKEYIRIAVPGDKSSVIERPVRIGHHPKCDNNRFAGAYAAFKQRVSQQVSGTPLKEWPPLSKSQVAELEYFNVNTVEQLAAMPDVHVRKFAGLSKLRDLARRFTEHARGMAPLAQMQTEIEKRDNALAAMQQQMEAMQNDLKRLNRANGANGADDPHETPAAPAARSNSQAPEFQTPDAEQADLDSMYASPALDLNNAAGSTDTSGGPDGVSADAAETSANASEDNDDAPTKRKSRKRRVVVE